jgi:hypothetical protein
MRSFIAALVACVLAGCAMSPPKPPQPQGEYRPVNLPAAASQSPSFEFSYEGDVLAALPALKEVAPDLTVLPPQGPATSVFVKVHLRTPDLEAALRSIAEQGRGMFEIVWTTSRAPGINRVFVRFRTRDAAPANGEEHHGSE